MAREDHLQLIKQGVDAWNTWRQQNLRVVPDLSAADLRRANLRGTNLIDADLIEAQLWKAYFRGAHLDRADLRRANLAEADLSDAYLSGANLGGANVTGARFGGADLRRTHLRAADLTDAHLGDADLTEADLRHANLEGAFLGGARLSGADLTDVVLRETVIANVDLSGTKGLHTFVHRGPSIIDHRTLQRSGQLPLSFLRGCGLPENLIEYLPSLLNQPIQFYSCFISYSSKDDEFARRLHADLQDKGIRCWFAPEDMKIGDRIRTRIDEVIRLHEKLLLVLSAHSIDSDWVEKEVEAAFEKERDNKSTVLFPVRLDDAVIESRTGWAADIKRTRHIGDFRRWKDHDAYRKAFERLLRDLRVEPATDAGTSMGNG